MMSNEFPKYVMFFCHGKTEKVFIKRVFELYVEAWFVEIFGEGSGYWKNSDENPVFINAEDRLGENYVCINEFENNVSDLLAHTLDKLSLENENSIFAFSILDINEDENESKAKRENILLNHDSIVKDIFEKNGSTIIGSKFIYFEGKIEDCLPNFIEYTEGTKGNKIHKIGIWLDKSISNIPIDEITSREKIRGMFDGIKNSNLMELFDQFDEWFKNLV